MWENEFVVAVEGNDDGPGTVDRPFATLARAQRAVRERTGQQRSDLVVSLRGGRYELPEPFYLDASLGDSGSNRHRVVYQAFGSGTDAREDVVLSGGREIRDWRPAGVEGVWRAEVGDLETRQLYVDGRRAERATLATGIPGTLRRTETGYVTDSTEPQGWASPADIEVVYSGVYPWTEARVGIAGIVGDEHSTTITMAQPAFGWAVALYNSVIPWAPDGSGVSNGTDSPTSVENSQSFLAADGGFALDTSSPGRHVLYYRPRAGEDLESARVVAPVLETLVRGQGSEDAPLHDVVLRGLTFAEATWLRPSRPEGFLHFFGDTFYDGGQIDTVYFASGEASVTIPSGQSGVIPGNVAFRACSRILVEECHFTRLGAHGLAFSHGSRENVVRGNTFDDISASAVAIGAYGPDTADANRGNRVENNLVSDIGADYHGSAGICLVSTQDSVVAHNQIHDVPHNGVLVQGSPVARGVQVLGNLVFDTMRVLADGAPIYLSSTQGASFASGTLIRGNVVHHTITSYNYGLYADYGASWVSFVGNVAYDNETTAVLGVDPPMENVIYVGNFWDAHPVGHEDPPKGVMLFGNTLLPDGEIENALKANKAATDILDNAGLQRTYRHLLKRQ